jgi:hypothetical protein
MKESDLITGTYEMLKRESSKMQADIQNGIRDE